MLTRSLSIRLFTTKHLPITNPLRNRFSTLHPTSRGKMSWMDSWSRPSKSQATPAPFYLLPNGDQTPYCRTCGRVISSRKSTSSKPANSEPPKYCSARCRGQKPGRLDREIEAAFVRFLQGDEPLDTNVKKVKGDTRVLVPCDVVEGKVFGERKDPEKVFGRRKNRASRVIPEKAEDEGVDVGHEKEEEDPGEEIIDEMLGRTRSSELDVDPSVMASLSVRSGTRVRPPQEKSQVNGSVGGEKGKAERIEETDEMREKRNEGQKKAHERELVRCAARRGVVFGFLVGEERRKCEAVMQGKVVEPSFAKGDWAVRWRED
ncbi:hypothetical protein COL154_002822 [Colletotrichum chrysophilum]|uniref:Uncharacterized protein n=2 Tax=Colletotrichum chrysophilum TaxID=1836956 RepID=A0AAD9EQD7_9PEZI|nr:hypothetical protein COL154_002822 [Colletotrichum chrysophilum]KAK1857175.1 hypothetical protein CCHR01_00249 [Colletotrichum chrysophilum]